MAGEFPAYHVTGAVHHYLRVPGSGILYLGTCESQPQVAFQELYKPVMNDFYGPQLEAQAVENGQTATVAMALNRFSFFTRNVMNSVIAPPTRSRYSRGLLTHGRTTLELWQVFENSLNPAVRALFPNLPRGWYWPMLQLTGDVPVRLGNGQDVLWLMSFAAKNFTNADRSLTLYSDADAAFPPETLVPQ